MTRADTSVGLLECHVTCCDRGGHKTNNDSNSEKLEANAFWHRNSFCK